VFHLAIAAATHNVVAIRMYDMIHAVRHDQAMWRTVKRRRQTAEERLEFQREHHEIFDALNGRNPERACGLMAQHIRATRRRLLDF
jgi:DNA-binding FadR family transcriptional regulator